ncbi:MAG TPA: YebC/PmpR family DNA-binding transcriptional regulator [Chthoniobacterales bacterium]|nr:YebC/PmpR family DNA-binding transcriptional regulator [Chthoniobacterales bacterium]
MAGHNKWSKIKRLKGALDVKRGKLFSRLSKEITVATRLGGGNPAFNPRLRSAILTARTESMPNDNIDRAIRKGTGELEATAVEEMVYEGYASGGVALIIETATDNKNRTAADLRNAMTKNHGNLGGPGSVAFMFHRKGQIQVSSGVADEDRLLEVILEAGAEELTREEDQFLITTPPDQLYSVAEALKTAGIEPESPKLTFIPENTVAVTDEQTAAQVLKLCDALDDLDDVMNVHANFDIPEDTLARLQGAH